MQLENFIITRHTIFSPLRSLRTSSTARSPPYYCSMSPLGRHSQSRDRPRVRQATLPRSKDGCTTCKRKRVKCDEKYPTCSRCSRLYGACDWTPIPSAKQKKKDYERIRHMPPAPLEPASTRSSHDESAPISCGPVQEDSDIVELEPDDTDEIFLNHDHSPETVSFPVDMDPVVFQSDNALPILDERVLLDMCDLDMAQAAMLQPSSPLLETILDPAAAFANLPGASCLTIQDRQALDFYAGDFTFGFGSKKPQWSTHAILLKMATHSPTMHHLLLAAASVEYCYAHGGHDLLMLENAARNYRLGHGLLADKLLSEDSDPLEVIPSFWFMYINHRRRPAGFCTPFSALSTSMADYITKLRVPDSILSASEDNPLAGPGPRRKYRPKDKATLARLINWLFWVDTQACFQGEGGAMAHALWQSISARGLNRMFEISSEELRLNHDNYPLDEMMDDTRNKMPLKMIHQIWMVHHEINRAVVSNRGEPRELDEEQCRDIEAKIDALRRNPTLSSMLGDSESKAKLRGRDLANCDWAVAGFYSLCIYHRRCSANVKDEGGKQEDDGVLDKLLTLIQRTLAVPDKGQIDRMQWPLFWAGIEAESQFAQDWIMDRLVNPSLRSALQFVLMEQADGSRISMRRIRDICQLTCCDMTSRFFG